MKKLYIILFIVNVITIMTSCSSSTKFVVFANPGTEILTPTKKTLGVVGNNGQIKLKLDDDEYYAFLLTHTSESNDYVPFALDYKYRSGFAVGMTEVTLGTIALAGLSTAIVGFLADKQGDENMGKVGAIGLAAGTAAAFGGLATSTRSNQLAYENGYKFLPRQFTNQDLSITTPKFESYIEQTNTEDIRQEASSIKTTAVASTISNKKLSQKASKSFKDWGTQIEGKYKGTGKLLLKSEMVETYVDITIALTRINNNTVSVEVFEADGEKFFPEPNEYKITRKSNGTFELILEKIPSAKIIIDKKHKLTYTHPRVNIDGDIYTLNINGMK